MKTEAVKKFYQLGKFNKRFLQLINRHGVKARFQYVNDKDVVFFSSAYSMPYPLAAAKEFQSIMEKVCENDGKRLGLLRKKTSGRSPASIEESKHFQEFRRRCQNYY
jgi:hypothetical protein